MTYIPLAVFGVFILFSYMQLYCTGEKKKKRKKKKKEKKRKDLQNISVHFLFGVSIVDQFPHTKSKKLKLFTESEASECFSITAQVLWRSVTPT